MFGKNFLTIFILILTTVVNFSSFVIAAETSKYCDFSNMYIGEDKYENFNRKMFSLNSNLNKFIARPIHVLWASLMPQCGIQGIQNVYNNIEYPKRLASCLMQKDFIGVKTETKRFLTNTTIGLGGLFDPADKIFKIKPVTENMDQALCKCKIKSGTYIVLPILSSSCPRSLLGRLIEAALDPSVYLASPLTSMIKGGFVVNKTSFMQPVSKMIESNYADPYDISKKMYGLESYIKSSNLDRKDLLSTEAKILEDRFIANTSEEDLETVSRQIQQIIDEEAVLAGMDELASLPKKGIPSSLVPDIWLTDYKVQSPVVDSMRTALFDYPNLNKSIWNELSIWNRSFPKRIKTDSISVYPDRDEYKFRYILQRNKNAPLAIFYPSVGEGINSHHSEVFAKIFYDAGYSVLIQGSHFQWEFAKSMPDGYCPGLPSRDADNLKLVTGKIIKKLQNDNSCEFNGKILVGTSFGAMATLFVADKEYKNNTLGISKYVAISPPIELVYAIKQVDKNSEDYDYKSFDVKHRVATTAAKIIQLSNQKKDPNFKFNGFPFTEEEGKLIVSYIMRQKLSDLIFTIEGASKTKKSPIYDSINNLSFKDYAEKYLLENSGGTLDDLRYDTSLYSIAGFLKESKNYKIYHSLDDFLINKNQLEQLKLYSPMNVVCLNNGSHLGFLYRKEFQEVFKKNIVITN